MGDHTHATFYNSHISCGVLELTNIRSDPEKVLYALCTHLYHPSRGSPCAFVIWSDTPESDGVKFANYVNLLFPIQESPWIENPKTSNQIKIWSWIIQHEHLKEWYLTERVKRAKQL